MRLQQFAIEGLGHLSTLIADEAAGVAVVVDPRRDVDVYLEAARSAKLQISQVVETHLHNDYVSGGRELAALTGASHVIGAGAELRHEHRPVRNGESFDVGTLRFRALDTPGHTPEHVSYAVADRSRSDEPLLLLTGGSLLVGAVGRTDLLGADHAASYAAAMHRSLHEVILRHEDSVAIYPTHGAGSLCSTGISSTSWSTIGYERRNDPLLAPMEVDAFARALLSGQPTFPRYFARMRPLNQAGPRLLGGIVPEIAALPVEDVAERLARGAVLVDARSPEAHAEGHIPGSLSIPAGDSFGTWLGWVVDADASVILLVDRRADLDDLARQALRIGFDGLAGYVDGDGHGDGRGGDGGGGGGGHGGGHGGGGDGDRGGGGGDGLAAWRRFGRPVEVGGRLDPDGLARALHASPEDRPLVIDVRQASEFEAGHVPGAWHIAGGSLPDRLAELPRDRPIATICASGYRSSVAASLLRAAGFTDVSWVTEGLPAWQDAGYETETGGAGDAVSAAAPEHDPERAHTH